MQYREENFLYSTGWSPIMAAAGAVVAAQINIAADAPFKNYYITIHVRQGVEDCELLVANWAGEIQINDSQVGKNMCNIAVPVDALAGNGQLPYNLAPPRIWAGNATVLFTITSNVATRTEVCVVLHGAKLFRAPERE